MLSIDMVSGRRLEDSLVELVDRSSGGQLGVGRVSRSEVGGTV